jgi:hypothetical protein
LEDIKYLSTKMMHLNIYHMYSRGTKTIYRLIPYIYIKMSLENLIETMKNKRLNSNNYSRLSEGPYNHIAVALDGVFRPQCAKEN